MKAKFISLLLIFVFVFTILLGCGKKAEKDLQKNFDYQIYVANILGKIANDVDFNFEGDERYQFVIPHPSNREGVADTVFQFDTDVEAKYSKTIRRQFCLYDHDVYENEDKTISILTKSGTLNMVFYSNNSDSVFPIKSKEPLKEKEDFINYFSQLLLKYASHVKLSRFKLLKITTVVHDENDNIKEELNDFYKTDKLSISEKDKVIYQYYFIRSIDGYESTEYVYFEIRSTGEVEHFRIENIGYFDEYSKLKINSKKINEIIDEKVKKLCAVDGYELKTYKKDMEKLVIENDVLYLCLVIKPEVYTSSGEKAEGTDDIYLMIKIDN